MGAQLLPHKAVALPCPVQPRKTPLYVNLPSHALPRINYNNIKLYLKLQLNLSHKIVWPVVTSHCNSFKDLLWSLLIADQQK